MRTLFVVLGTSFLISFCHPVYQSFLLDNEDFETTFLDTLVVSSSKVSEQEKKLVYHESASKSIDLIHTQLNLSFDWEQQMVIGQTSLLLKPFFYPLDSFEIDAINFTFDSLALIRDRNPIAFHYSYNGSQLKFHSEKTFTPKDTLEVIIHYRVKPESDENHQSNGDDKGLYFIQKDSLTNRRQEIWTIGETQWSAKWFPTINQPNEKSTQSIHLTIDTSLTSISNGILVSTQVHNDGTKTDHWELNLPHSTYLTSVIIGQFEIEKDTTGPIELEYFVQPGFKSEIPFIFGRVSEMINFFSDTFQYHFPWPNYKQIIVQDFVSGAMENTTAVIYGDFIQWNRNELVGFGNDAIVAHELVHHWFGNLVTCESWANITLNEGFAHYGEALWIANYYGREAGEYHRYINLKKYLNDAYLSGPLPVVSHYFSDPEKLFNSHTYNKGGAILHTLRSLVGDSGFFESISAYLIENEFSNTELDHLRLSFEKITGLDLSQFFDQWFYQPGHPRISFQASYDTTSYVFKLLLNQENAFKKEFQQLFSFPIQIGYIINEDYKEYKFYMSNEREEYSIPLPEEPEMIILDPQLNLLAEYNVSYNAAQWEKMLKLPINIGWKIRSFESIMLQADERTQSKLIKWGLNNTSPIFQRLALQAIDDYQWQVFADTLSIIATFSEYPDIRAQAWKVLRNVSITDNSKYIRKRMTIENSAVVLAEMIKSLEQPFPILNEVDWITTFENRPESSIIDALGKIYSRGRYFDKLSFFEKNLHTIQDVFSASFYESYLSLFPERGLMKLFSIAMDSRNSRLQKYGATFAIYHLAKVWTNIPSSIRSKAKLYLDNILSAEKDRTLIDLYFAFK